jgi:hypothetical protein
MSRHKGWHDREQLDRCPVSGCHREPAGDECRECHGRPCPHHTVLAADGIVCERCDRGRQTVGPDGEDRSFSNP